MKKPSIRFNKSKKTIKRALKAVLSTSKPKVSRTIKAYVSKAIARNVENKNAQPVTHNNLAVRTYGYVNPHQLTCEDLTSIFNVPVGTEDGQRIGDVIKVKNISLKGYINVDSSLVNNDQFKKNPMYVKMFVGRRVDTIDNPNNYTSTSTTNIGFNNFFLNGPTATNPLNLPSDMYRLVNKSVYRIYATRFFKIGSSAPSNNPSDSGQWNNDFSFAKTFRINLSKHFNTLRYDPNSIKPANAGLYCWFVVCFANGSSVNPIDNSTPLEWHYDLNMMYEDA
nr:MAG: putative capsid protein [Arizlama virus]